MNEVKIEFEKIMALPRPVFGTKEGNDYYDSIIDKFDEIKTLSNVRYNVPANYTNPRCFVRFVAKFLNERVHEMKYKSEDVNRLCDIVVADLLEYNIPFYLIEKDIFIALLNTDPPEESWNIEQNPLPFPACGFLFPHDLLVVDKERNVVIDWSVLGSFKFEKGHSRLIAISNDKVNHCFLLSSIHEDHALSKDVPVYDEKASTSKLPPNRIEVSMEKINNVMKILYNIVTLMNSCPEYVDSKQGSKEIKPKRQGDPIKIFKDCRTIGKNFRIVYNNSGHAVPSGKVMPLHKRRGHWHNLAKKGVRLTPELSVKKNPELFRKQFIPPMWINA